MDTPHIVVIMADQLKASALGIYGNPACPTPNLERLASEGVTFDCAITPHPLCVPARVAFWTGKYPHQTGCRRNETLMPEGCNHAFRSWRERGYRCALIGKNHCFEERDYRELFETWLELGHGGLSRSGMQKGAWVVDTGPLEEVHRQADEVLTGPYRHLACYTPDIAPEAHTTGIATAQAEAFIEANAESPFALWVSFPAPHEPYIVPESYFDRIDPGLIELPPWSLEELEALPARSRFLYRMLNAGNDRTGLAQAVQGYLANALFVDDAVGRIVSTIEKAGIRDNTILVFCSDHGDFAGEHNMTIKGGCFYDCLTRVPLLMSWPDRIPVNLRVECPVSLVDVIPTICALTGNTDLPTTGGLPLPGCTDTPGRVAAFGEYGAGMELLPTEIERATLERYSGLDAVMATLQWREAEGRRKMVRTGRWKYTHDPMDPIDELYDLESDPGERWNLASDPRHAEVISGLRSLLLDWSIRTEDAIPVPHPASSSG